MAGARLYGFWGSLAEGLRTGQPQNEAKDGDNIFARIYADPQQLRQFLSAMSGISMGSAIAIAKKFPWKQYKTFLDVGGAQGCVPVQVALAHPHLSGGEFDLAPVGPVFQDYVKSFGLERRLTLRRQAASTIRGRTASVDEEGGLPKDLRRAPRRARFDGCGNQVEPGRIKRLELASLTFASWTHVAALLQHRPPAFTRARRA